MKFIQCVVFSTFLLVFSSCQKDKITLEWQQITSPYKADWRGIRFFDAQNGVIIGGNTWSGGFSLRTQNGGKTWHADSVQQWSLYGLDMDKNPKNTEGVALYTVGISGQIFNIKKTDTTFKKSAHPYWQWFRDVAVRRGTGVSVGGQAWQAGIVATFEAGGSGAIHLDTFPQEIESVAFADDSTVVAVGYGLLIQSNNGGLSWKINNNIQGDFFTSICFPSEKTGYIVGFNGTILKTEDKANTWKSLKSPRKIGGERFNAVFFTDILRGWICGDNGLLWRTLDGGDTWTIMTGLPNTNFYDVFTNDTEGWLVGADATIIQFKL